MNNFVEKEDFWKRRRSYNKGIFIISDFGIIQIIESMIESGGNLEKFMLMEDLVLLLSENLNWGLYRQEEI